MSLPVKYRPRQRLANAPSHPSGMKSLPLPAIKSFDPLHGIVEKERGSMSVMPAGKPPKMRFKPGQFIRFRKQLWEIVCAFRVARDPHEWLYELEERDGFQTVGARDEAQILRSVGCGDKTPRVVREIFRGETDAMQFFADIPRYKSGVTVSNKTLLAEKAEVQSSGEVLP